MSNNPSPTRNKLLLAAVGRNDVAAVLHYSAHGADVNCVADDGDTPLSYAARFGFTAIIIFLIASGADPNDKLDVSRHCPKVQLIFSHSRETRLERQRLRKLVKAAKAAKENR